MAFRLYVGNYPFTFTVKGVANLFRDFDGVKIEKICHSHENSKSFAFLTCDDIDQLVSVIKKMNKTKVCGRNLIVRACDPSLQEYVDLILQNVDTSASAIEKLNSAPEESSSIIEKPCSSPEESSPMRVMRYKCRPQHRKSDSEKSCLRDTFGSNRKSFEKSDDFGQRPISRNSSCFSEEMPNNLMNRTNVKSQSSTSSSSSDNNKHGYFETRSNHYTKPLQNSYQTTRQNDTVYPVSSASESQSYCQLGQDRFNSFSGYSYNSDIDTQVPKYNTDEHFYEQRVSDSPTWISVTNFQFGTSVKAFYDLFSDYKPIKVKMIRNEPQRERMLAEAHVCFPNRDIADDVILNFDNTLFEGRIILVNDVEDLTIMNELLNLSHS